jgi:hypothetical protein
LAKVPYQSTTGSVISCSLWRLLTVSPTPSLISFSYSSLEIVIGRLLGPFRYNFYVCSRRYLVILPSAASSTFPDVQINSIQKGKSIQKINSNPCAITPKRTDTNPTSSAPHKSPRCFPHTAFYTARSRPAPDGHHSAAPSRSSIHDRTRHPRDYIPLHDTPSGMLRWLFWMSRRGR